MTDYTRLLVFKQALAVLVLRGEKDVTRRLARDGHRLDQPRWREGALARVYARQPYQGGEALADVRVLTCKLEPLRSLGRAELKREGLGTFDPERFVPFFLDMHGLRDATGVQVWRVEIALRHVTHAGHTFLTQQDLELLRS